MNHSLCSDRMIRNDTLEVIDLQNIFTVADIRKSEKAAFDNGISSRELMSRAAEAVFNHLQPLQPPFAVICGSGNNAGDGYAIAILLAAAALPCTVIRISETVSSDSRFFFDRCNELNIPLERISENTDFNRFNTIVDCIFGIGYHDPMPVDVASVIERINQSKAYVVSVDIASGLNADNGTGSPIRADLTVSIGELKPGHFLNQGMDFSGRVVNHGIGLSVARSDICLFGPEDLPRTLFYREHFTNKSTFGYIGLIGGCLQYQGAIRLASMAAAAMRSGCGVVRLGFPRSLLDTVAPNVLESTLFPFSCNNSGELVFNADELYRFCRGLKAIAFGMGIGTGTEARKLLLFLLHEYHGILIIDADGLNLLSGLTEAEYGHPSCRIVLTPHLLEFSRLSGLTVDEIRSSLITAACDYARSHAVTLLLKGPCTLVTDGVSSRLLISGCAGMATAGSGDVLSGITAALCGSCGDDLLTAVASAAWLNGTAGEEAEKEYGAAGMIAGDTARMIPKVILSLNKSV